MIIFKLVSSLNSKPFQVFILIKRQFWQKKMKNEQKEPIEKGAANKKSHTVCVDCVAPSKKLDNLLKRSLESLIDDSKVNDEREKKKD